MDNPNAFPVNAANLGGPGAYEPDPGMTLRDWFAGQALTGWMHDGLPRDRDDVVAHECYAMADAMLAERAKAGAQ